VGDRSWRECPACTDYHFAALREPVRLRCSTCAHEWPLMCPSCGTAVGGIETRTISTGATVDRMRCSCGYTCTDWNVSRKSKRVSLRSRARREECSRCHGPAFDGHADHIVPLWRGGADCLANVWWLCRPCHAAKTAKEATERAALRREDARE
jgi:5-methylcytosine-specific restriction endonuclease McrA